ncbi:MAG: hypothetical protein K9W43_13505 [Candidatus Thorarchaeota archaeon]|nr:hypothetical protein [Candidatus Thorarchaeota archaeon]
MSDDEKRGGKIVFRRFAQDLYRTGLHSDEIGIRQIDQWRSKSRQFTADADVIGKILESSFEDDSRKLSPLEKVGFIILRQSTWDQASDPLSRRFVIKLFSQSGRWLATAEEMVADELANSYASGIPLLSLAIMTSENEIVTYVRQMRRRAGASEAYGFFIAGPSGDFEVFSIEGKRGTLGDDFRVLLLSGNSAEVAEIDSKFADVGGEFIVSVKDRILAENDWFCRILQCFSVFVRYRKKVRSRVADLMDAWRLGKYQPRQHRFELTLLANPRRLTLKPRELEEV